MTTVYASVVAASPLTVRVDGDTATLPASLLVTGFTPTAAARVLVLVRGARLIVLGGLP